MAWAVASRAFGASILPPAFCSLLTAHCLLLTLGSDLKAGVAFYGRQAGVADVPKISAPLMFNYAGDDQGVNTGIANYEAALKANNKVFESHIYEGKQHGFPERHDAAL